MSSYFEAGGTRNRFTGERYWIHKRGQLGEMKVQTVAKVQTDIQAKIQAEAEEKKRAYEIKIQMAKIEADKELTLKKKE